jgi:hypothetical protein
MQRPEHWPRSAAEPLFGRLQYRAEPTIRKWNADKESYYPIKSQPDGNTFRACVRMLFEIGRTAGTWKGHNWLCSLAAGGCGRKNGRLENNNVGGFFRRSNQSMSNVYRFNSGGFEDHSRAMNVPLDESTARNLFSLIPMETLRRMKCDPAMEHPRSLFTTVVPVPRALLHPHLMMAKTPSTMNSAMNDQVSVYVECVPRVSYIDVLDLFACADETQIRTCRMCR